MNFIQWYAFFILPVIGIALGWTAVLLNDWNMRRKHPERGRRG